MLELQIEPSAPAVHSSVARVGRRRGSRWLVLAVALALASTETAGAQPGTPDPATQVARERYQAGVAAYDSGKFEEARVAFQQAYDLTKKPAVLLNLGLSESKSGHPAEGGNHLLQFLREYKQAKPSEVTSASEAIDELKQRIGQVAVTVNVVGADISIETSNVGKSPIFEPLFAEPGSRTVSANLNGAMTSTRVDVKKGQVAAASLTLAVAVQPGPPGPGPTWPTPVGPDQPPVYNNPPSGPNGPPLIGPPPPYTPFQPPPPSGQGESFGHWYTHKPLAWVGTGLTVLGLGLGIGFSAAAGSSASTANDAASQIRSHATADGISGPCSQSGNGDYPGYGTACSALRNASSTRNTDVAVGAVGWVTFALAGGATVTYALLDWLPKSKSGEPSVGVMPIVAPGYAGVMGRF